jgi:hypothetical protein
MPDANSIAIVLVATAAASLLTRLRRGIGRRVLAYRLGRALRLAVRRELARGTGRGFLYGDASRRVPGTGGEDIAA